ncbi:MAG TPA: deoxyribose-phosphate aldolase [Chitinophagaceae bacterium]|nr:deoxyribose-phosphate aldolase [Chitinophagaceae bacterium]
MNLASYIDHTLLKPSILTAEVERLCTEATQYGFAAVCIPPPFVNRARTILAPTAIKVATVIGFPFGYSIIEAKLAETVMAVVDGADELDMVINIAALKNNDWSYLEQEIRTVMQVVRSKNKTIKVIIESGILTDAEIIDCCRLYAKAGVDYVKTSTGYAEKGATIEHVQLMRSHLPSDIRIKASGGIRTAEFARQLVAAGADRLGCSASVAIVNG